MIHSINLQQLHGSTWTRLSSYKMQTHYTDQMGASGNIFMGSTTACKHAKEPFLAQTGNGSWAVRKSQSSPPCLLCPFLTCSLCPLRLKSQNKETRASIIILENMAKGFHQSGSGDRDYSVGHSGIQPAIQRMNEVICLLDSFWSCYPHELC